MKKILGFSVCCLAILAAAYLLSSPTVEQANAAEQDAANRVLQTASTYRDSLRAILDPTTTPSDAATATFLATTKDLQNLATTWEQDIDRLEKLGNNQFNEWQSVIQTIQTTAAREPEQQNWIHNLERFNQSLRASRTAVQQLKETLAKGEDVTRCIKSREYDQATQALAQNLNALTATLRGRGDAYLKACDRLVELLQQRESMRQS